jgi:hypothetical protein
MSDPPRVVTIFLPDGYKDAMEFAKDCGFQLAAPPIVQVQDTRPVMPNLTANQWPMRNGDGFPTS